MIKEEFSFKDPYLHYYVGLNQIRLLQEVFELDRLIQITSILQTQFSETVIQFFNDKYVLNQNHIFQAIYFALKAFKEKKNISNKENIEILLYLSCNRQIKVALDSFGLKQNNLGTKKLSYCILSDKDNIQEINDELFKLLKPENLTLTINSVSKDKYNRIRDFYEITNLQLKTVLNSYNIIVNSSLTDISLDKLYLGLEDLICERMASLSLENV